MYQPIDSECINACSYRHMDVADMDERFVLSSRGDNISPTYVYCNYKKGYFNPDGKFNLNYDEDVIVISDICMHINESNPCKKGKYPLPDGLCVSECEHGFDRNPPDFLCRPMGSSVNISTTTTDRTLTQGTSLISTTQSSTEGINTTNFRGRTSIKTITADDENDNITNEAVPWWHYLLYCCVGIVVFSIIGACIYKRQSLLECLNRKRRRHDHTVNYKFEKVDTVNICNCAEPHVPGF
ncbi:uncharacterized protein LOC132720276 [Ruditapes philippinarum]|uniref:uncharacterized protein LOC132720276 n=1 Tax=Ruditapes philippinarum TaxID=129788 RepID=UPI00295ACF7D|nr:uncharacterized protein LOC132720276 [Ruditapes philippinarum]